METKIEKIPSLVCKKCGSFRITVTDDGPECEECDVKSKSHDTNLSMEIEYLIHQLKRRENED
jgi:hypothetical protein